MTTHKISMLFTRETFCFQILPFASISQISQGSSLWIPQKRWWWGPIHHQASYRQNRQGAQWKMWAMPCPSSINPYTLKSAIMDWSGSWGSGPQQSSDWTSVSKNQCMFPHSQTKIWYLSGHILATSLYFWCIYSIGDRIIESMLFKLLKFFSHAQAVVKDQCLSSSVSSQEMVGKEYLFNCLSAWDFTAVDCVTVLASAGFDSSNLVLVDCAEEFWSLSSAILAPLIRWNSYD